MESLSIFWYCIILVAIIAYAVLDGFDLGVGILHFFSRDDYERRVFLNAIGPVWDGNAVWLIIVVGGLFAGFPAAYATLMSAFYTPIMVFLCGIILRAISIEFRSKRPSQFWRGTWDFFFSLGSLIIAFGVGVILGNLIHGIKIDQNQVYVGELSDFFNPYSILVGVMSIACFTMHGALYLTMKTEGELHDKIRRWITPSIVFFAFLYVLTTMATLIYQPHMMAPIKEEPWLFLLPVCAFIAIANIPRSINKGNDGWAFISSAVGIALLIAVYGLGAFPILVRSSIDPAFSLNIYNADASHMTLKILAIIVAIGVPLVLLYAYIAYRTFKGKVHIDTHSY